MSHTNSTTYMNLPLFIGTDKPAWLTDFNSAMQAIDTTCSQHKTDIDANTLAINALQAAIGAMYPVGSIYMNVTNMDPGNVFGGTWVRIKDCFLLGAGDIFPAGSTGGEAEHTLVTNEMPPHKHALTSDGAGYAWSWGGSGKTVYAPAAVAAGNGSGNQLNSKQGVYNETGATGGGQPHNNMPPYIAVYVWQRTA